MEDPISFISGLIAGVLIAVLLIVPLSTTRIPKTPSQSWKLYVEQRDYHLRMLEGEE